MAFTNREIFVGKVNAALRAVIDLRARALYESTGFVPMDDTGYTAASTALDAIIALNSTNTTLAPKHS